MAFLDHVLEPPTYGWQDENGDLIKPTPGQIFKEFFFRLNVFRDKRNWLQAFAWMQVFVLLPFFLLFIFKFFSIPLLIVGFVYSMIVMGTHGTIWHHRYCTHGAYTFKNNFWRFITQNLSIKVIVEEAYAISHHVHHAKSDQPGDPYNSAGGFLYCFLADVNHQAISRTLSEADYARTVNLLKNTGVTPNTYAQYQKYATVANPFRTIVHWLINWGFWFAFFLVIGMALHMAHPVALPVTIFGSAFFWAVGIRTFNFESHGKGKDKRTEGVDYNWDDMSINQLWPGYVAGEWHNNHHLFPKSARTGFLPHQIDFAFYYIKLLSLIGGVSQYRDAKKQFIEEYRKPYLEMKKSGKSPIISKRPVSNVKNLAVEAK